MTAQLGQTTWSHGVEARTTITGLPWAQVDAFKAALRFALTEVSWAYEYIRAQDIRVATDHGATVDLEIDWYTGGEMCDMAGKGAPTVRNVLQAMQGGAA